MTAKVSIFCSCGSTLCPNFEGAREAGKGVSYSTRGPSPETNPVELHFQGKSKNP